MSRITKQKTFVLEKVQGRDALDSFSHLALPVLGNRSGLGLWA